MQFCQGFDLEKQLQLIAASESHLSFIFGLTQRRNQNLQKRKQLRLGIRQAACSSFSIDQGLSFDHLKTFAKQGDIYAKGKALTESSTEFVLSAASASAACSQYEYEASHPFSSSSHHTPTSKPVLLLQPHFHTPNPIPGTRMS